MTFRVFGDQNLSEHEEIQQSIPFQSWDKLSNQEKETALKYLNQKGWIDEYDDRIFNTVKYLNENYVRESPGKNLLNVTNLRDNYGSISQAARKASVNDYIEIFLKSKESIVYCLITKYAAQLENTNKFINFKNCINHLFEQFSVNKKLIDSGLIPKQDKRITDTIYEPVMEILSAEKYKSLNLKISKMFEDFTNKKYDEVITKAHTVIHSFLGTILGESNNGKGELSKLFIKAKDNGKIPVDRFSEPIINAFKSYLPAVRAESSTAKPASKNANEADALLIMNVTMVFIQYCLHTENKK